MGIKVYISGNSGNKEIVTHQQRIFMILNSLSIEFEPVDIAAPGRESDRDFMREKGKKKNGQRNVLPPQIFHDEKYCGDYDDFDLANEDDELEEFLGIPRKTPKSTPSLAAAGKPAVTDAAEATDSAAAPTENGVAEDAGAEKEEAATNESESPEVTPTEAPAENAESVDQPTEQSAEVTTEPLEGEVVEEAAVEAEEEEAAEEGGDEEEEGEYEEEEEGGEEEE